MSSLRPRSVRARLRRHRGVAAVVVLSVFGSVACSGAGDGEGRAGPSAPPAGPSTCTTTASATTTGAGTSAAATAAGAPSTAAAPGATATVPTDLAARARFPVAVRPDQRHLEDADGQPFLMIGDAAWSIIADLERDEVDRYLADRRARGFNTLLVSLIEHAFAHDAPNNAFGDPPFERPGDYTAPNEAYFAHADWVLGRARDEGFLVLLTPSYTGFKDTDHGWWEEMKVAGADALRGYGRYVATRYAALDNIVWVQGGDSDPPDKALIDALAEGIADGDPSVLQTAHTAPETAPFDYWNGRSWLAVNNAYTYEDVYPAARREYDRGTLPYFLMESTYENERDVSQPRLRTQAYHALLTGATGHVFGNNPVWHFSGPGLWPADRTWEEALDSAGARSVAVQSNVLRSRPWWTLVPDEPDGGLLVGGRGRGNDRAVAARSCAGTLALVYVPDRRTVELDLSVMRSVATLTWIDPTTGATRPAEPPTAPTDTRLELSTPGDNAEGSTDWLLEVRAA